jgi:glycosyltransferase involved in cell wall biosynthesis
MEQLLDGIARLHAGGHGDAQLVLTGEAGAQLDPQPGVRVLGHLEADDRWDALAGATAAVVPSFHESLSLLALESWSVGRPVLLNAASPVLAGQGARSGGAIAYTGAGELAAAAAQLLSNDGRAAMLGAAGRTYVQTVYRWPAVHHRIVDLITAAGRRRGDP